MNNFDAILINELLPYLRTPAEEDILQESFQNSLSPFKKVISEEGKKLLKKMKFKESKKLNDTCPIFQEKFEEEDEIIQLPCNHCFIPDAIERWLEKENNICPVCRYEFDWIEKRQPPPVAPRNRRTSYHNTLIREIESIGNRPRIEDTPRSELRRRTRAETSRERPIQREREYIEPLNTPLTPPEIIRHTPRPRTLPPLPQQRISTTSARVERMLPRTPLSRLESPMFPRITPRANTNFFHPSRYRFNDGFDDPLNDSFF